MTDFFPSFENMASYIIVFITHPPVILLDAELTVNKEIGIATKSILVTIAVIFVAVVLMNGNSVLM